jgi:hypothetical protein
MTPEQPITTTGCGYAITIGSIVVADSTVFIINCDVILTIIIIIRVEMHIELYLKQTTQVTSITQQITHKSTNPLTDLCEIEPQPKSNCFYEGLFE